MKDKLKLVIPILIVAGVVAAFYDRNAENADVKPNVEEVKLETPTFGVREIGGGRIEQAKAFLIIANLSKSPGDLLNFINAFCLRLAVHSKCQ